LKEALVKAGRAHAALVFDENGLAQPTHRRSSRSRSRLVTRGAVLAFPATFFPANPLRLRTNHLVIDLCADYLLLGIVQR
jgi:hypothetical protein